MTPLTSEPCAGCGADVFWLRREFSREYMQVDALPSMRGTVIIDLDAQIYRVPPAQGRVYPLYAMHFMSCPLTQAWRGGDPSAHQAVHEMTEMPQEETA